MSKILLVSGSTDTLLSWKEVLSIGGHTVDIALTGNEAISRAVSGRPGLVMINETEETKATLIKQLRQDVRTGHIPVITLDFTHITRSDIVLEKIRVLTTPKKVLIAEDDRHMSNILKMLLESQGFEVKNAFDGAETLNTLKSWSSDLIVLDIMLPVIDGFHLCQMINEDHTIAIKPKIIIISGRESEWDKNLGAACGAEFYLVKPFDNSVFLKKVQEVLRGVNVDNA